MTACTRGGGEVRWRELTLDVPDGWVVAERDDQKLSIANADFGPGQAEELEAAVFLTHEPGASIDAWRGLVAEREGRVESDRPIEVGGVPANRLIFRHDANGTPVREMVVVVPSRDLVMLFQPVVLRGSVEGPATFERYRDAFEGVLGTLRFEGAGGAESPRDLSATGPSRAIGASVLGGSV